MLIRRPRFQRSAQVSPIRLTPRDLEVVRHIARHRFLRSSQIAVLMASSRQQILRRLNLLYHHGYLERPRCQIDYYYAGGSRSMVYGLGKRGFAMLHRMDGLRSSYPGKSTEPVKRLFLEHTLQVAEFMVRLELACRQHGAVKLIPADQLVLPDETRNQREPFQWKVSIKSMDKIGVIPDQVFGLEWKDQTNKPHRAYYFLESDLGTMPIERRGLHQSSLLRKLLAYASTWEQNLHQTRLGFHRFRVLFVTNTPARAGNLIETARQLERGSGLFLSTDFEALQQTPYLLTHPWQTTRPGVPATLLE